MEIYAYARDYMKAHGNPHQWGDTNWPPETLIRCDIESGNSYVCEHNGRIVGTFFYHYGKDIEPSYRVISDGAWLDHSPYGVIHRIAADGSERGTGSFCIDWAYEKCRHLRIDTHGDNTTMQALLNRLGFTHCGTIFVEEDNYPRLAYEKTAATDAGLESKKQQQTGQRMEQRADAEGGRELFRKRCAGRTAAELE